MNGISLSYDFQLCEKLINQEFIMDELLLTFEETFAKFTEMEMEISVN